jgi:hypothetical protein
MCVVGVLVSCGELWCGGVVVLWCCGVVIVWWCGVVLLWWCGGVVVWWCGGGTKVVIVGFGFVVVTNGGSGCGGVVEMVGV